MIKLVKKMFGFGNAKVVSHSKIDNDQKEDLKKRKFLEWQIKTMAGLSKQEGPLNGLLYVGNNTWRFNPSFGHVREFIVLKDLTERQKPVIKYGKVNDQWVKLQHNGYFVVENQEHWGNDYGGNDYE